MFPTGMNDHRRPPLRFSIGCQEVFFLNDADFLAGDCPSNRPERIRFASLHLSGPVGTNGIARLTVQGSAEPVVFHVVNGVKNLVTASTEIPLAVTDEISCTGDHAIYVSCPKLGTGTISATFTSADGGEPLTASATFRCVEPLRKLVTTEKSGGRYVNPSRLVMGTNAVLKVGANGDFSPSEVRWSVVSGPGVVFPTNGWETTVTPTGPGTVTVEARFNDDEIQPRFVLPVVQPRTIPVRAFVVQPPETFNQDVAADTNNINVAWTTQEIYKMLDTANKIFEQVGFEFDLVGQPTTVGTTNDWNLTLGTFEMDGTGTPRWKYSSACTNLLNSYAASDCIELYFTGSVVYRRGCVAATTPYGIVVGKSKVRTTTLAHELGHALGLEDCYARMKNAKMGVVASVLHAEEPVDGQFFRGGSGDWGDERGRGFYAKEDIRLAVAGRLLMYGFSSDSRADIPTGRVLSLTRDSGTGTPDTLWSGVGESCIKKLITEAYSR